MVTNPALVNMFCPEPFPEVEACRVEGRGSQTIVSDLDGTLLRSRSAFPYFMLVAFEAGSALRSILLLLLSPLIWILYNFFSETAGIKMLIFLSCAGLEASVIESVARGVLPKFYLEDMHSVSYRVFLSCGKRYVVTANPRIMVEHFLKEHLDVEAVMGTELQISQSGYATGFVTGLGVLVGANKERAVKKYFSDDLPDVALGDSVSDYPFMALCKEAYFVPSFKVVTPVPRSAYLKPLIFHDGRLVCRPTPLVSLVIVLWAPIGIVLAITRMIVATSTPIWLALPINAMLGVCVRVKGIPPTCGQMSGKRGILFVCSHRTLLDPIFLSIAVRRRVTAVTYSISRLSEVLSPIRTVRLTRCRTTDATTMLKLLEEGDLAVCPEGTTCREPYLLRFSSLFAELTDQIVPVTMNIKMTMFHGTTARGWKGLDPFFFLMNPCPKYEVTFLEQLPPEMTCSSGKSSHDVANYVQRVLAVSLGFQCTDLTRRDKYRVLAGNDGIVPDPNSKVRNRFMGC
ncbi:hypothetical protein KC19_6G183900 [Ceratodon purpureus]|uniref:Phospholipid/glycerol acyltransferase domain-containing protein n=1 Tax=Ceratodon purpureus TaxID=3225 RepID=A0A8T0HHM2_CERPU|nr:hypothetical protein KC19_6G183900 [Ceratodon purpureus]